MCFAGKSLYKLRRELDETAREGKLDYENKLDEALSRLHEEGRYRTFIEIERRKGQFPHATWTKPDGSDMPVTVWCGNDYLAWASIQLFLKPCMKPSTPPAPGRAAHATFRAPRFTTNGLRPSWQTCTARKPRWSLPRLHRQ